MGSGPPNFGNVLPDVWQTPAVPHMEPQTRSCQTEKGAPQPAGLRMAAETLLISGDRSAFLSLHWDLRPSSALTASSHSTTLLLHLEITPR